jgi:hypothetical protein
MNPFPLFWNQLSNRIPSVEKDQIKKIIGIDAVNENLVFIIF